MAPPRRATPWHLCVPCALRSGVGGGRPPPVTACACGLQCAAAGKADGGRRPGCTRARRI